MTIQYLLFIVNSNDGNIYSALIPFLSIIRVIPEQEQ